LSEVFLATASQVTLRGREADHSPPCSAEV